MWLDIIGDGVEELRPWRFGTNWLSQNNRHNDVIEMLRNDHFREGTEYEHVYRRSYKRDRDTGDQLDARTGAATPQQQLQEHLRKTEARKSGRAARREEFQSVKEDILKNTQPAESTEPTEPTPPDGVKKLNIGRESAGFRTPSGGGGGVHTDIFSKTV